jgi:hypothetical protein
MEYKGIKYSIYPEFSAFVAEAYGGVGDDEVDVILRASTLTELIGYVKPENVIVDHRSLSRPPKYFVDFLHNRLFKDTKGFGTKRIFIILQESELQYALRNYLDRPPYAFLCTSLEEVFEIIKREPGP